MNYSRANDSAFPTPAVVCPKSGETVWSGVDGMAMREWWAGMAMQGLLAACASGRAWPSTEELAAKAFEYADAMIAFSSKNGVSS